MAIPLLTTPEGSEPALPRVTVDRSLPIPVTTRVNGLRRHIWRARFIPVILLLIMCGGIIGLYFQPPGLQLVFRALDLTPGGGTSNPIAVPAEAKPLPAEAAPRATTVVGLGKLLPAGDVVVIAPPFGAGDARIAELKVGEGDRVSRGQILAVLDSEPAFKAAVDQARATVAAREAQVAQTRASVRASREEAVAALERAEATARNAHLEFERNDSLYRKGLLSVASLDQKRTLRDESRREVQKAKASLSRWAAVAPDEQPDVIVAIRNRDAAKADLARAIDDLKKTQVIAPIDGTVLTVHVRAGEKPGTAGILNLGNIDEMTIEVEVDQSRIGAVAVGDGVEATATALPGPLKGKVARIGLEVGRQVLTDPNPAANTDARVVKVTVDLDAESSDLARRFTNLQVVARIDVSRDVAAAKSTP